MAADLERDRIVRTDMERIFRPLVERPPMPARPAAERDGGTARAVGGPRWIARGAAGLVVLSAAAIAIPYGTMRQSTSRPASERPGAPPADAAAPRDVSDAPRATDPDPAIRSAALSGPDQASPANDARLSAVSSATGEALATKAPKTGSAPRVVADAASGSRARRDQGTSPPAEERCAPGSLDDRCIYQDVLQADARLLAAYRRAARGDVPAKDLNAVRRRWLRAREVSQERPDDMIRRYDRLADELDDLTREERR